MRNENIRVIGLAVLITIITCGCKKLVNVGLPPNKISADFVFTDSVSAVSASLYSYASLSTFQSVNDPLFAVYVDDLSNINGGSDGTTFFNTQLPTNYTAVSNAWMYPYRVIYNCNTIIEQMSGNSRLSLALANRLIGESMFCRAYAYFYLLNIYGDVPLVLTTNVNLTSNVKRTSADSIYRQMVADLVSSCRLLNDQYSGEGRVRATRLSSLALLARVYLYEKNYTGADSAASVVINSNLFSLGSTSSVFSEASTETILSAWNQFGYTVGTKFVPFSATSKPPYGMTPSLLAQFAPGDLRRAWIDSTTISGITYYYPYKYQATTKTQPNGPEFQVMLRLGEIYLIRSEARGHESNPSGALTDLNTIRVRAGLPVIANVADPAVIDSLVLTERRCELFTEGGHRFFDLRRMGAIDAVMGVAKASTWRSAADYFPIPAKEITINPNLTQNPGYN